MTSDMERIESDLLKVRLARGIFMLALGIMQLVVIGIQIEYSGRESDALMPSPLPISLIPFVIMSFVTGIAVLILAFNVKKGSISSSDMGNIFLLVSLWLEIYFLLLLLVPMTFREILIEIGVIGVLFMSIVGFQSLLFFFAVVMELYLIVKMTRLQRTFQTQSGSVLP